MPFSSPKCVVSILVLFSSSHAAPLPTALELEQALSRSPAPSYSRTCLSQCLGEHDARASRDIFSGKTLEERYRRLGASLSGRERILNYFQNKEELPHPPPPSPKSRVETMQPLPKEQMQAYWNERNKQWEGLTTQSDWYNAINRGARMLRTWPLERTERFYAGPEWDSHRPLSMMSGKTPESWANIKPDGDSSAEERRLWDAAQGAWERPKPGTGKTGKDLTRWMRSRSKAASRARRGEHASGSPA